ncbi:MAG: hypothetical protein ABIF87_07135 [Pseudomonadota bacterium]
MEIGSQSFRLLEETIGIPIEIVSNDYNEFPAYEDSRNTYQRIVFQIKEEEPDMFAVGALFTLSLMSFTFSAPRGISEIHFVPDEKWNLDYFLQGLEFKGKNLCFSSDYVSGRLMKTDMTFESGGKVTLTTRNRGRGAERWLAHLQGKKHIEVAGQSNGQEP